MQATYAIIGMHCSSCTGKVRAALAGLADTIEVSLSPPEVCLSGRSIPDIATLQTALSKAGAYRIEPAPSVEVRSAEPSRETSSWIQTYWPLLIIAGYIALVSFAGAFSEAGIDWARWMTNFMAGFFLVFSAFKFLDLNGFADAYATYDLLAKRWHGYGYVYPFLELALGCAYLFHFAPTATHVATIALMGFSSLGVISALQEKRTIQCACLGTALKLPMSTITLVEDLGMVAMAAIALAIGGHG